MTTQVGVDSDAVTTDQVTEDELPWPEILPEFVGKHSAPINKIGWCVGPFSPSERFGLRGEAAKHEVKGCNYSSHASVECLTARNTCVVVPMSTLDGWSAMRGVSPVD